MDRVLQVKVRVPQTRAGENNGVTRSDFSSPHSSHWLCWSLVAFVAFGQDTLPKQVGLQAGYPLKGYVAVNDLTFKERGSGHLKGSGHLIVLKTIEEH